MNWGYQQYYQPYGHQGNQFGHQQSSQFGQHFGGYQSAHSQGSNVAQLLAAMGYGPQQGYSQSPYHQGSGFQNLGMPAYSGLQQPYQDPRWGALGNIFGYGQPQQPFPQQGVFGAQHYGARQPGFFGGGGDVVIGNVLTGLFQARSGIQAKVAAANQAAKSFANSNVMSFERGAQTVSPLLGKNNPRDRVTDYTFGPQDGKSYRTKTIGGERYSEFERTLLHTVFFVNYADDVTTVGNGDGSFNVQELSRLSGLTEAEVTELIPYFNENTDDPEARYKDEKQVVSANNFELDRKEAMVFIRFLTDEKGRITFKTRKEIADFVAILNGDDTAFKESEGYKKYDKQLKALDKKHKEYTEKVKGPTDDLEKLEEALDLEKAKGDPDSKTIAGFNKEIESTQKKIDEANDDAEEIRKEMDELEADMEASQSKFADEARSQYRSDISEFHADNAKILNRVIKISESLADKVTKGKASVAAKDAIEDGPLVDEDETDEIKELGVPYDPSAKVTIKAVTELENPEKDEMGIETDLDDLADNTDPSYVPVFTQKVNSFNLSSGTTIRHAATEGQLSEISPELVTKIKSSGVASSPVLVRLTDVSGKQKLIHVTFNDLTAPQSDNFDNLTKVNNLSGVTQDGVNLVPVYPVKGDGNRDDKTGLNKEKAPLNDQKTVYKYDSFNRGLKNKLKDQKPYPGDALVLITNGGEVSSIPVRDDNFEVATVKNVPESKNTVEDFIGFVEANYNEPGTVAVTDVTTEAEADEAIQKFIKDGQDNELNAFEDIDFASNNVGDVNRLRLRQLLLDDNSFFTIYGVIYRPENPETKLDGSNIAAQITKTMGPNALQKIQSGELSSDGLKNSLSLAGYKINAQAYDAIDTYVNSVKAKPFPPAPVLKPKTISEKMAEQGFENKAGHLKYNYKLADADKAKVAIAPGYSIKVTVHKDAKKSLDDLLKAAKKAGHTLQISEKDAYRTDEYQQKLVNKEMARVISTNEAYLSLTQLAKVLEDDSDIKKQDIERKLEITIADKASFVAQLKSGGYSLTPKQKQLLIELVSDNYQEQALIESLFVSGKKESVMADTYKSVAPVGYSGHQTGMVVDFNAGVTGPEHDDYDVAFGKTQEYQWLQKNAAKYGFVMPFTENNPQGVKVEQWHWEFRGNGDDKKYQSEAAKKVFETSSKLPKDFNTQSPPIIPAQNPGGGNGISTSEEFLNVFSDRIDKVKDNLLNTSPQSLDAQLSAIISGFSTQANPIKPFAQWSESEKKLLREALTSKGVENKADENQSEIQPENLANEFISLLKTVESDKGWFNALKKDFEKTDDVNKIETIINEHIKIISDKAERSGFNANYDTWPEAQKKTLEKALLPDALYQKRWPEKSTETKTSEIKTSAALLGLMGEEKVRGLKLQLSIYKDKESVIPFMNDLKYGLEESDDVSIQLYDYWPEEQKKALEKELLPEHLYDARWNEAVVDTAIEFFDLVRKENQTITFEELIKRDYEWNPDLDVEMNLNAYIEVVAESKNLRYTAYKNWSRDEKQKLEETVLSEKIYKKRWSSTNPLSTPLKKLDKLEERIEKSKIDVTTVIAKPLTSKNLKDAYAEATASSEYSASNNDVEEFLTVFKEKGYTLPTDNTQLKPLKAEVEKFLDVQRAFALANAIDGDDDKSISLSEVEGGLLGQISQDNKVALFGDSDNITLEDGFKMFYRIFRFSTSPGMNLVASDFDAISKNATAQWDISEISRDLTDEYLNSIGITFK